MDYRLAAARRLLAIGAECERARSIIDSQRPFFPAASLLASPDPALARLARGIAPRVARLEVVFNGVPHPIGTAWPVTTQGSFDNPAPSLRFLTAGHMLKVFRKSRQALAHAAALAGEDLWPGQVVFPNGMTYAIDRWICAAGWDLAVFDIRLDQGQPPPPGLLLTPPAGPPGDLVVIGYALQRNVAFYEQLYPGYAGQLFLGIGGRRTTRPPDAPVFEHDATTIRGYSGCPVLDRTSGQVIGLHFQGSGGGTMLRSPGASDWNDAVWTLAFMQGWLGQIIAGNLHQPPPDPAIIHWIGGAEPRPLEMQDDLLSLASFGLPQAAPDDGSGVVADRPDARDRMYQPGAGRSLAAVAPWRGPVGNQFHEGSCAAFAVAAAIERQLQDRDDYTLCPWPQFTASVRMLDRMARRHDEWLDDVQDGTSLRAVLKGFYHNGVCREADCPYLPWQTDFFLTRPLARQARDITLGAYLRVALTLDDMLMAVQDTGAVMVTARVHRGWLRLGKGGRIGFHPARPPRTLGHHAFVITGYDRDGFIVLNSRGRSWGGYRGAPGHALWSFEDWAANCLDAWVLRLAPPAERAFAVPVAAATGSAPPRRQALLGHMIRAERSGLVEEGTLGLGLRGIAETAAYLGSSEGARKYRRILLIFHSPLLDDDQIARLAQQLTLPLKARRVYPLHILYGSDELAGLRLRISSQMAEAQARYQREGGLRDAALLRQLRPMVQAQIGFHLHGARLAARRILRDALAVLPLAAATLDRPMQVVSAGLGAAAATALAQVAPEFRLPHLAIAPPLAPARDARCWLLRDRMRDDSDLAGWQGSWDDLIADAHDRSIRSHDGAAAATVQQFMAAPQFIPSILARLDAEFGHPR
ncbi:MULTISPECIES: C1 family peptidase [unclassified Paracoccus (in: a-proteobacteria)]|uniref:C1 family peptidase n=1 Tax=unclassified Paracoccus (in: a-proteobacteria) TaxID=2688777 RepID=UPI0021E0FE04|nr:MULTISPECIES: C1 family peptidase [unclassified Paracoccus (in: a-proteobacteria)]UXU76531.1 C1 family peptidase [Paracoccus sp. SMMA_5]UXU82402.1 C1 family peptidase [Paracoccus sp. SMMA_5_TC]